MNRSKTVLHGTPVVKRLGKWIRCRNGQAPQGVWNNAKYLTIITDDGLVNVRTPAGVVIVVIQGAA